MSTIKPAIERFLALTRINPGGCWDWLGAIGGMKGYANYGQFVLSAPRGQKRVRIAPYRFIWEWVNDRPMPDGLEPDHTCNNGRCVNPAHIEPVTHSENQRRAYQRGRKRPGVDYVLRARPTQCPHGHEYTEWNTRINSQGGIVCRTCDRQRCHAYQAKKRAARPDVRVIRYPSMFTGEAAHG